MKISILSDLHLGFGWNTELVNDSFENAKEAISKAIESESDIVLIAGDIFDKRLPTTGMWLETLKILSKAVLTKNKNVKFIGGIGKDFEEVSKRTLEATPVIALHGTHERRGKGQVNAIEVLECTGLLIHLHCNGLKLEKDGQKVAIQGMSGVPERYAKEVLDRWNPRPIEGYYNILMLHQNIEPYIYSPLEPPTLNISDLSRNFDLIINGHIHTHDLIKVDDGFLMHPGSTIVTQMREEESKVPKGFYQLELPKGEFKFIELENNRKFFFREIIVDETERLIDRIEAEIDEILEGKFKQKKEPLIKFKILGKKTDIIDRELKEIKKEYEGKAILKFSKQLESSEIAKKLELLKKMRTEKMSLEEIGMKLLHDNLKNMDFKNHFDFEILFKLLSDGQVDRALNMLTKEQKTLNQVFNER